jgi:uncharacterized membrane protein
MAVDDKKERDRLIGLGLALGAAFGLLLGMIVFDNAGVGLALGPGIGLAIALAYHEDRRDRRRGPEGR